MATSQVLSEQEWLCAVQKRLRTNDCKILKVTVSQLGGDVGGFLGDHLRVRLSVMTHLSSSPETQEVAFFVKRIPLDHQSQGELVQSSQGFPKETGLFSTLFSLYPESENPWAPQCYFVRPDALVLDDLIYEKFRLAGRKKCLDYAHCVLLLRALAVFHAGSIIIEENQAKKTNKPCRLNELYPDLLFENFFVDDNSFKTNMWFHSAVESLASSVILLEKYKRNINVNEVNIQTFKKFIYQLYEIVKPSNKYRNVVSHGDLWTNNMLFKYDEDDETPVQVRMVDFQLVRYAPPAIDVMTFLHINTPQEFRIANIEKFLSLYHNCLGEELRRHGYRVEDYLPWPEFRESCDVYNIAGCIYAPCYHTFNIMDESVLRERLTPEKFSEFFFGNRYELVEYCCETDPDYKERLLTELEELVECMLTRQSKTFEDTSKSN
ncbi:uncharacterized protein [Anabrus simplex]|uniref:uncharacterized protein n=1 Tax=Anabrus simplex TaxID=316456 RepID=UPI0034DD7CE4